MLDAGAGRELCGENRAQMLAHCPRGELALAARAWRIGRTVYHAGAAVECERGFRDHAIGVRGPMSSCTRIRYGESGRIATFAGLTCAAMFVSRAAETR